MQKIEHEKIELKKIIQNENCTQRKSIAGKLGTKKSCTNIHIYFKNKLYIYIYVPIGNGLKNYSN